MIKKVFYLMAALVLLTYSCTVNEVENQNFTTQEVISLSPNTAKTRAAIVFSDSLTRDVHGFRVYADTSNTGSWYSDGVNKINGDNSHVFASGKWGFEQPVLWPFPFPTMMRFYAYYPDTINSNVIIWVDTARTGGPFVQLNITIPADKAFQEDVLATRGTATSKPATGTLPLSFKHILTKVNFSVSTWDDGGRVTDANQKVFVMAVGFCNLKRSGLYHIHSESWASLDNVRDTFDYFNRFTPLTTGTYRDSMFVDTVRAPFYSSAAGVNQHLMLLPQSVTTWDFNSGAAPLDTIAHVRMLYRMEASGKADSIGYATAHTHPSHPQYGGTLTTGYAGPLYVLVGYGYDGTNWVPGRGYNYEIPIPGSGGGVLLDDCYYDNQARRRPDFPLQGGLRMYSHVLGNDNIKLAPTMTDWDDTTTPTLDVLE